MRWGLDAQLLQLEITEGVFMQPRAAVASVNRLHLLGVSVAIDDFGTGFSSLSQIAHLPIDALKIDRSFVAHAEHDAGADGVVSAIVALARRLGLRTVGEGVETERQRELLLRCGCERLQGYLYARPMPAHELDAWLDGKA